MQGLRQLLGPTVSLASGEQRTSFELAACPFSELVHALLVTGQQACKALHAQLPGLENEALKEQGRLLRDLDLYGVCTRPEEAGALVNWFEVNAVVKEVGASSLQHTAVRAGRLPATAGLCHVRRMSMYFT